MLVLFEFSLCVFPFFFFSPPNVLDRLVAMLHVYFSYLLFGSRIAAASGPFFRSSVFDSRFPVRLLGNIIPPFPQPFFSFPLARCVFFVVLTIYVALLFSSICSFVLLFLLSGFHIAPKVHCVSPVSLWLLFSVWCCTGFFLSFSFFFRRVNIATPSQSYRPNTSLSQCFSAPRYECPPGIRVLSFLATCTAFKWVSLLPS